jgi:hypothetical protein
MTQSDYVIPLNNSIACGSVVWWGLSGTVELEALTKALSDECVPESMEPGSPSLEVAAVRAVQTTLRPDQRLEVVAKRRLWEVELLGVGTDIDDGVGTRTHTKCLRVSIEETPDKAKRVHIIARHPDWENQKRQALDLVDVCSNRLAHNDISEWLIWVAVERCKAVTLRESGGIYFIPKDYVDLWNMVVAALQSVSAHRCFALPAMKSEDAAQALMVSVRNEANAALHAFEAYLEGTTSTKGLNAIERDLTDALMKVDLYCDLLGTSLPGFYDRAELIRGAVVAARLGGGAK